MALVPWADVRLLPESSRQPSIWPTQLIVHSIVGSAEGAYSYFLNSAGVESHFLLKKDGQLIQLMDTSVEADANYLANVRAVSVETEDNGDPDSDPWTQEQLETLVRLARWASATHGIPLVRAPAWDAPGLGYHSQYEEWSPVAKTCPGLIRIRQFNEVLLPVLEGRMTEQEVTELFNKTLHEWFYRVLLYLKTDQPNSYISPATMPQLPFGTEEV